MKTSICFAYKKESPCPHCGAPRVGYDYDDDYYVGPGIIKEYPACEAEDIQIPWEEYPNVKIDSRDNARGAYEKGRQQASKNRDEAEQRARELAKQPCPQCGGNPRFVSDPPQWSTYYFLVCCKGKHPDPHKGRRYVEAVKGCKKCGESFSWPGIGLTSGD